MVFWYHMYGSSIGSLSVYLNVSSNTKLWWRKYGYQGNQWYKGVVGIGKRSNAFQVIFLGKRYVQNYFQYDAC